MSWLLATSHRHIERKRKLRFVCLFITEERFVGISSSGRCNRNHCLFFSFSSLSFCLAQILVGKSPTITIRFDTARSFAKLSAFVLEQRRQVDHDPFAEQHQIDCVECLNTFGMHQYYLEERRQTEWLIIVIALFNAYLIQPCSKSLGHIWENLRRRFHWSLPKSPRTSDLDQRRQSHVSHPWITIDYFLVYRSLWRTDWLRSVSLDVDLRGPSCCHREWWRCLDWLKFEHLSAS